MPAASGAGKPHRLSWRANGDNLDVALAVNRVLSAGGRAWRLRAGDASFDAGDYLLELTARQHAAIARLGLVPTPATESLPAAAERLAVPAVLVFAGAASAFPYFAYYSRACCVWGWLTCRATAHRYRVARSTVRIC
jgi:hypothetical protein